jgi:hypothetical protein
MQGGHTHEIHQIVSHNHSHWVLDGPFDHKHMIAPQQAGSETLA